MAGLEPARGCPRGILSPLRLPIPPHQRTHCVILYCMDLRAKHCSIELINANGWRWIRTTEAICSRFTVCPLWPLGNLPISFRTICALTVIDYITSIFSPQAFYVKISSSFPAFPANCSKTSALFFQFHRVPAIIFVILDIQLILSHII